MRGPQPPRLVELARRRARSAAALALGGAALLGKLGSDTTIQQVSPLAQGTGLGNVALQAPPTKGLTPERIYQQDAPGVVQITATSVTQSTDPSAAPSTQTEQSLGSGFVIDKAGHIVTNFHVVQGATEGAGLVLGPGPARSDGRRQRSARPTPRC